MSTFYMDTSALVKYYIDEIGSNWVRTLVDADPQPAILSSQLLIPEITSAFQRRLRERTIEGRKIIEQQATGLTSFAYCVLLSEPILVSAHYFS